MNLKEQENLQRQIALFQTIVNHANAVIGAKDINGNYIFVNKEYSRLFHLDQKAFIGQTDYDLFSADIAKLFREADEKVIAEEEVINVEETAPVDGELRDFLSAKFPIYDDKGELFATDLVATDFTERKQEGLKVLKLANTDQLTQVSNRNSFNQHFD